MQGDKINKTVDKKCQESSLFYSTILTLEQVRIGMRAEIEAVEKKQGTGKAFSELLTDVEKIPMLYYLVENNIKQLKEFIKKERK